MMTKGSIRPKGLKRGVSTKKWCAALGVAEDLRETCGNLELTASGPQDAEFLRQMFWAMTGREYTIVIFDKKGEEVSRTILEPAEEEQRQAYEDVQRQEHGENE